MRPTADPTTAGLTGVDVTITPGMVLPVPDDAAAKAARERLASMDMGVNAPTLTALGMLAEAVVAIAAIQGSAYPRPLLSTRVVLVTGLHTGGLVAGPTPDPRHAQPLAHLAAAAGAGVVTLEWQPAAAVIELEDAITPEQMDAALHAGWEEAERAADEGIELLVLAAGGAGAPAAAAAVVGAVTGAEPTLLLGRVVTPAGLYDDNAWMTRCLALRDALYRVRHRDGDPRTVLAALGGADIACATGLLLGAAHRRTPVMIDGPVGAAAALLANDFSEQSRRWLLLPDTGRQMTVRYAAEALDLRPWQDLCLDLGEGATALAALPLLQTALTLAGVGHPVGPAPLTRISANGNQIFVGVARPVEPVPAITSRADAPPDADAEVSPQTSVPDADGDSTEANLAGSDVVHPDASAAAAAAASMMPTVVGTPSAEDTAFVLYTARSAGKAQDGAEQMPGSAADDPASAPGGAANAATDTAGDQKATTSNAAPRKTSGARARSGLAARRAAGAKPAKPSSGHTAKATAPRQMLSKTPARAANAKTMKRVTAATPAPAADAPPAIDASPAERDVVMAESTMETSKIVDLQDPDPSLGEDTAGKNRTEASSAQTNNSSSKDTATKDTPPKNTQTKTTQAKNAQTNDTRVHTSGAKTEAEAEPLRGNRARSGEAEPLASATTAPTAAPRPRKRS